jgi:hypothetical protein
MLTEEHAVIQGHRVMLTTEDVITSAARDPTEFPAFVERASDSFPTDRPVVISMSVLKATHAATEDAETQKAATSVSARVATKWTQTLRIASMWMSVQEVLTSAREKQCAKTWTAHTSVPVGMGLLCLLKDTAV